MSQEAIERAKARALEFKYPAHVPAPKASGIYFGLSEIEYHNDVANGSTDEKRLAESPCDYWFNSKLNPDWQPEEPTEAQKNGTAWHKCVLEGRAKFERLYAPISERGSTTAGKREREAILAAGKEWLKEDVWRRIQLTSAMIRNNPYISDAFDGGAGAETSIFWIDANGIRKKARIDKLKFRASVDLKTIANQYNKHFPAACRDQIARFRYDAQAAHYNEGRSYLAEFVKQGLVFGKPDDEDELIAAANAKTWAFVFIFCQKEDAPLTWGTMLSPQSDVLKAGKDLLARADANWLQYVEQFGLDTPWVTSEPLRELPIEEMPGFYGRE